MTNKTVLSDAAIQQAAQCLVAEAQSDGETVTIKNVNQCLRNIEQALLQSPEIQQRLWQPIETAPKDGRVMILLLTPSRFPQVAWSNTWWTARFSVENKPTHWMLVPEMPVDAAMEQKP